MKKPVNPGAGQYPADSSSSEFAPLIDELRGLIQSARFAAVTRVNTLQVLTNFEIGRRIVEHEQQGEQRADYGKELLRQLSARLTDEFGKGFSLTNLKLMRQFFLQYRARSNPLDADGSTPR